MERIMYATKADINEIKQELKQFEERLVQRDTQYVHYLVEVIQHSTKEILTEIHKISQNEAITMESEKKIEEYISKLMNITKATLGKEHEMVSRLTVGRTIGL